MRYVAIPLLLLAILLAAFIGALVYFDVTREEVRDFVIIIYGVAGILFFLIATIAALGTFMLLYGAYRAGRGAFEERVSPVVDDVAGAVHTARGAVEFASDTAVSPLIKVVAFTRGVRRGVDAVADRARRGR